MHFILCFSAVFLLFDHNSKKNGSNGFLPLLLPFTTISRGRSPNATERSEVF